MPPSDLKDVANEVLAGIPQNVRWQLDVLVPRMMSKLPLQASATNGSTELDAAQAAQPVSDPYRVRIVLEHPPAADGEQLKSIEIIEAVGGKRLDGAWWLDRADGPGVLIGMDGMSYERQLWQSPVKYVRQTRGVGLDTTTYRQKVSAPKGSAKTNVFRYVTVRVYHIGVDMVAPKGMEVHAVGNATVGFAGRLGGYGNLIILNHGLGYQTYYAHLSKIEKGVKLGTSVSRGEVIGLVGSTGHSTAPHLHFETRKDGKYIDPFDETRQLGFWLLTADDQERLAIELLASEPAPAGSELGSVDGDSVTHP
jgi:murein DD-endopeptidase MepM/ murein hydrolase activator NlpD